MGPRENRVSSDLKASGSPFSAQTYSVGQPPPSALSPPSRYSPLLLHPHGHLCAQMNTATEVLVGPSKIKMRVHAFDAFHCAGAVQLLFENADCGRILHTGAYTLRTLLLTPPLLHPRCEGRGLLLPPNGAFTVTWAPLSNANRAH